LTNEASSIPAFGPDETAVIWNPTAGNPATRGRARRLLKELQIRGYDLRASLTAGHATELARQAADEGKRCVIAVGGDGTLCEIIADLPADTILAYYPSGSGNNFALNFHLPEDPQAWLAVFDSGTTRPMRFGLCNERPFASVASVGFDAQLVRNVPGRLKKHLHQGAYVVEFLPTYVAYSSPCFRVTVDGEPWRDGVLGVIVGRGMYYGGPHPILPDCDPGADQLSYIIMEGNSKWRIGKFAVGMVRNTLPEMEGVTTGMARTIHVESEPASYVQLDGDVYGTNPVTFSVDSLTRRILAP
jgi:diacylglycerol kinase (ATP)